MRLWTISSVDDAAAGAAQWYADHAFAQGADDPRVARAWVLETADHHETEGPSAPAAFAIFESRDLQGPEDAYRPDPAQWDQCPVAVQGARVSTRQVIADLWFASNGGPWWCSIRIDPRNDEVRGRWDELEDWYTFRHIGETAVGQGFHEAWRLGEELQASAPTTHHPHFRWAMYEQDRPEDMMVHVNKAPLQPIWHEFVDAESFSRGYHKVVASK